MGLNTSYDCWNGPYSSFNNFRKHLAKQIGLDLDEYVEYSMPLRHDTCNRTKTLKDVKHNLIPLLNHSDCEGKLTIAQCKKIVNGLNDVLCYFNDEEVYPTFRDDVIQFRDGCIQAIIDNKPVEFH